MRSTNQLSMTTLSETVQRGEPAPGRPNALGTTPEVPRAHDTVGCELFRSLKGHDLKIRRLCAQDRANLDHFVKALSNESRRLRFFSPVRNLDPALLERLLDLDFENNAAFAAVDANDSVRAVGRYSRTGAAVAEIAFAVDDTLQGEGVGTELLHHLVVHARAKGFTEFTALVLAENRQMLEVFRNSGYPVRIAYNGNILDVHVSLTPEEAGAPPVAVGRASGL